MGVVIQVCRKNSFEHIPRSEIIMTPKDSSTYQKLIPDISKESSTLKIHSSDNNIESMNEDAKSPDKQIAQSDDPCLFLKVIGRDIKSMQKNSVIRIDPNGIFRSQQYNFIDNSVVVFGWGSEKKVHVSIGELNELDKNLIDLEGESFKIWYDQFSKNYKIKDSGKGFGIFGRIEERRALSSDHLLSMGNGFILIQINPNDFDFIDIQIFGFKNQKKKLYYSKEFDIDNDQNFNFDGKAQKVITIGRSLNNTIVIDDHGLSKVHCKFEYFQETKWTLIDGNSLNKPSTNGIWEYISHEKTIYNGMEFKTCGATFVATIKNALQFINF